MTAVISLSHGEVRIRCYQGRGGEIDRTRLGNLQILDVFAVLLLIQTVEFWITSRPSSSVCGVGDACCHRYFTLRFFGGCPVWRRRLVERCIC